MALKNPWVGYVTRSYQQIKSSLVDRLVVSNPEITDHSESNILIIIISMFAGLVEMLNYYIDNMAREAFIATARRFSSMVKLVKLLDYRIKVSYPATVDLTFTFNNPLTGLGQIPLGTIVSTGNGVQFITTGNLNLGIGDTSGKIGARQVTQLLAQNIGTTDGTQNQAVAMGNYLVEKSTQTQIDSITWTEVNSFGFSTPTNKHYIIEVDVDGVAYMVFGNGINGEIPPSGKNIIVDYCITQGPLGNVDANTITTIISTITLPGVTNTTVNNLLAASGGSSYEDMESIRISAPLSIRTLDRAVTRQDYIDIARLAPGVGKAEVDFDCGKDVDIYIAPNGGGIAQSPLLFSVANFMEVRKMITTFIHILPAGETRLEISLDVTIRFRADKNIALTDIQNALVDYGSFAKQNINKKVKISDIIAIVDNLEKVDNLDLIKLTTKPYARPYNHTTELNWLRTTNSSSTIKKIWELRYLTPGIFTLTQNGLTVANIPLNTPFSEPNGIFDMTIQSGPYVIGQKWVFITYPANQNIIIDDFSVPKVEVGDLNINIIEQLTQPIE